MNFVFRIVVFCLFLVLGTWDHDAMLYGQNRPSSQEVSLEKKLIEGKKYTLLGDWEKAEAVFRAILEEDVQNSAACYELSRTLNAAGKSAEALTFIRRAIRIEPDNEWYQLMEADIHEKAGDLYAAMDMYDKLIRLRPDKAHYYEMQIQFSKKTDEKERLLNVLDQYELIRGVNESITRTRFETLDALGRTAEALATIHRLTEVFPSQIDYKFLAASYAKKIGQEQTALDYYKAVLAIDPENARAKLALAGVGKKEGNIPDYLASITPVIINPAVELDVKLQELIPHVVEWSKNPQEPMGLILLDLTQQLVKSHPKDAKSYAIQGDVLAILGRDEEAIRSYKQATQLNGSIYLVWQQLLSLLMINRSYEELIRQARLAIDQFPNQAFLYYAAGYGAYKTRHLNDALSMLNDALIMTGRQTAQKVNIYNILGLVYDELGDLEKSSIAFETALGIDPKNAETLAQYSLVLSRRISQSEKALAMTGRVLSQGQHPPMVHEIMAEVLYNQKKYKEAYDSILNVLGPRAHADTYNLAGDILVQLGNTGEAVLMWEKALETGSTDSAVKKKIADHKTQ